MTAQETPANALRMKRGSFPPYMSLSDAFAFVRSIYEQGGGEASYDVASRLLNNSASSSSFFKKTGALKLYGLITEQSKKFLLTETGYAIAAPVSEFASANARKSAFLSVSVFAKIYERHKGKLVPADEFLKNIIEQDMGIPRDLSSDWVKAFHESSKAAGLTYIRPDGKVQLMESGQPEVTSRQPSPEGSVLPSNSAPMVIENLPLIPAGASLAFPISASGSHTKFELSDGRIAEFNIPFGITARDAKRLKSYLKGMDFIIDSATVDPEDSPP